MTPCLPFLLGSGTRVTPCLPFLLSFPGFEAPCLKPSTRTGPGDSTNCVTGSHKNREAPCLPISVAPCLPMPKPRALPESLGSGLCLRAAAVAAVDLFDVRRSCRRAPRAPSRPHCRAPTDAILTFSSVAALPIAAPAHTSQHDDSEPAPSREHVVP